ncbi:BTAD domain-containing putative transcriptional regulator [Streptomyces sp. NPDC050509]|uniref:BTAD domain-containing putative transcriptional regulator n=1 Tax=Streptomyces sp. NPDC050509 TaxID=3365620 RepID=UPI0037B3320E
MSTPAPASSGRRIAAIAVRCQKPEAGAVARSTRWPQRVRAAGRKTTAPVTAVDALSAYEAARQRLAEALGADPGPPLRSLHTRMLRQDRDLLPPPPVAVS